MPLTPDEEQQLEHLLRKKYGGAATSDESSRDDLPAAEPSSESLKVHGDKINLKRKQ
jgi:hypothetical protein